MTIAGVLTLVLVGCSAKPDPISDYRSYLEAVADGRIDDAFAALAAETRQRLEVMAADDLGRAGAAAPGRAGKVQKSVVTTAKDLFRARVLRHGVPVVTREALGRSHLRLSEVTGERATLDVATPDGDRRVTLVREDGHHRVVLTLE